MGLAFETVVDAAKPAISWRKPMTEKKPSLPDTAARASESQIAAKRDAAWLLAIAERRDSAALTQLFQIYGPKLKGWLMARGVGSSTAEDLIQDVMIKVWTRAGQFDPAKASFATWVYRMTRNLWIDHKRKHGRMDVRDPELMKLIADDSVNSVETEFIQSEREDTLTERMRTLTNVQQTTLRMAYMEFKTHKEIAEETGIPLGTVKTRIRSAILALRDKFEDDLS